MRQRARAAPIARQVSPLAIGVQLQRTAGMATAATVVAGGGSDGGLIMTLTAATLAYPGQGATCSYLLEVINIIPGMYSTFSATWDGMGGAGPSGQFDASSNGSAVFHAIDPMTGLTFYATMNDGTVLTISVAPCV